MQKKVVLGAIFSLLVLLGIIFTIRTIKLKTDIKELQENIVHAQANYPDIYNVVDSITLSSFKNKVQNNTDFVVYIGRPTCGDCTELEPKLIEMIKETQLQDKILYLNVAQLRKNETEWKNFIQTYGIKYTPTIAHFKNGELVDKVNWTPENGTDLDEFNTFFTSYADKY